MHIKKITTTGRWVQAHKITVAIRLVRTKKASDLVQEQRFEP